MPPRSLRLVRAGPVPVSSLESDNAAEFPRGAVGQYGLQLLERQTFGEVIVKASSKCSRFIGLRRIPSEGYQHNVIKSFVSPYHAGDLKTIWICPCTSGFASLTNRTASRPLSHIVI
ncbi:hypothetical protein OKW41_007517 [Paraburkholderia sp. UCT70]